MEQPPLASGLGQTLERLISSRTVIGEPITVQGITLVPVLDVTFGFGTGATPEKTGGTACSFLASGMVSGAKISPRAVIVVCQNQVDIYSLSSSGPVERVLDRLPGLAGSIIDQIKAMTQPQAEDE